MPWCLWTDRDDSCDESAIDIISECPLLNLIEVSVRATMSRWCLSMTDRGLCQGYDVKVVFVDE